MVGIDFRPPLQSDYTYCVCSYRKEEMNFRKGGESLGAPSSYMVMHYV